MQVQPYFHFIPKPTAAEIWPRSPTGPSDNTRGVADPRRKPTQPSFSSQCCSRTIAVSSTARPTVPLPGAGVIFPWKCLAWIPLSGKSLCSPLRRVWLSCLWTPQAVTSPPLPPSLQAGKPNSLSLSLYVLPLRWRWVDIGLAGLSLVCP